MNPDPKKIRLVLIGIGIGALVLWYFTRPEPEAPPAAGAAAPAARGGVVAIEDGKTIDFSSGKAVVTDTPDDKAVIDAAVKEMDEAVKGVTFGPPAKQ